MTLYPIASGYKADLFLLEHEKEYIAFEMSATAKYVKESLQSLDIEACDIQACLLTHGTKTRMESLARVEKISCSQPYDGIPIYVGGETVFEYVENFIQSPDLPAATQKALAILEDKVHSISKEGVTIGSFHVKAVDLPHYIPCGGFIVSAGEEKTAFLTHFGSVEEELFQRLKEEKVQTIVLEGNYDDEIMEESSSPLKERTMKDNGLLSNVNMAQTVANLYEHGLKAVVVANRSVDNNDEEYPQEWVESHLDEYGFPDDGVKVHLAPYGDTEEGIAKKAQNSNRTITYIKPYSVHVATGEKTEL